MAHANLPDTLTPEERSERMSRVTWTKPSDGKGREIRRMILISSLYGGKADMQRFIFVASE
jgi:hypothetical protein